MYDLIKNSGILWQNYRDELALTNLALLLIFMLLIKVIRLCLNKN